MDGLWAQPLGSSGLLGRSHHGPGGPRAPSRASCDVGQRVPPDPLTPSSEPARPMVAARPVGRRDWGSWQGLGGLHTLASLEPGGPPTLKAVGLGCGRVGVGSFSVAATEPRPGNWLGEEQGGSLALQSRGCETRKVLLLGKRYMTSVLLGPEFCPPSLLATRHKSRGRGRSSREIRGCRPHFFSLRGPRSPSRVDAAWTQARA